ncbi:tRNA 2-thiouridine(34) synthase MnmA [bacterium]|nr:tRNA 2-thiouridine(34) synthase MnmA [Candidatus Atribacteria bacterium]MBU4561931.1 tRNA 2-thiouridine(34) synthase MnmA [bacterium]
MSKDKVIVGMSGGVDSSVAAALLKEEGYEVIGVTMEIWDGGTISKEGAHHACYGPGEEEDIKDAQKVAQILGIPFYIFDLKQEYKTFVLDYFSHEYLSGRTPNPCIMCNQRVKFGAMVKKIYDSGVEFDYFATGHYTRVEYDKVQHRYLLKKAKDLKKDQSYFLYSLSQEQLGHILFPIGDYTKEEVKKIARNLEFGINNKPESQDFITGDYSFLFNKVTRSGPILNKQGKVLGRHKGIPFYTIGQRKGLGISNGERLYVTAIDPERNAIVVGTKEDLLGDKLIASNLNWISMKKLKKPIKVKAKIRYLHSEAEVEVIPLDKEKIHVKFREPQMAITPGQAIVFYDGDIVVGGGVIEKRI